VTEDTLWLPVAGAADLPAGGLLPVRALGRDIVVWRTAAGVLAAAHDRCPHRGTPLSLGRVCNEELVCPYHGWAFAPQGRCIRIPSMARAPLGERQALALVEVREHLGLLWVRFGAAHHAAALAQPPAIELPQGPGIRQVLCGPYRVATSFGRVIENFLDIAHFGFVHPGTLGDAEHTLIADYTVSAPSPAAGPETMDVRVWQPRSNLNADQGAHVRYRYQVLSPWVALLEKCPEGWQDFAEMVVMLAQPVEPALTRVWFILAMSAGDRTDADMRAFQEAIFTEDQALLEGQRPALLPLDPEREVSCAADRLSLAYRDYLRQLPLTFGTLSQTPPSSGG
jgi:phenylpropionate dioxygenase-like ring-hydroxylating dioxygenase large terminal subunit